MRGLDHGREGVVGQLFQMLVIGFGEEIAFLESPALIEPAHYPVKVYAWHISLPWSEKVRIPPQESALAGRGAIGNHV